MLRESEDVDLSGKSLSKVAELVEINRRLRDAGLDVEVGLSTSSEGNWSAEFSLRSVAPGGDATPVLVPRDAAYRQNLLSDMLSIDPVPDEDTLRELSKDIPYGKIRIRRPKESDGPCNGAMTVDITTQTKKGWGPLLYDLAMEWASLEGRGGLMSGRSIVDPSAQAVWDKYATARLSDVEAVQLDIKPEYLKPNKDGSRSFWGTKQLTPDKPEDDCEQFITGEHAKGIVDEEGVGDWQFSPLSRVYMKTDNEVTRTLSDLDLLW
jgi:hypothetical protein